ncbi:Melanoma inhibitory activity protein 2 [Plecturocebus cupreus]
MHLMFQIQHLAMVPHHCVGLHPKQELFFLLQLCWRVHSDSHLCFQGEEEEAQDAQGILWTIRLPMKQENQAVIGQSYLDSALPPQRQDRFYCNSGRLSGPAELRSFNMPSLDKMEGSMRFEMESSRNNTKGDLGNLNVPASSFPAENKANAPGFVPPPRSIVSSGYKGSVHEKRTSFAPTSSRKHVWSFLRLFSTKRFPRSTICSICNEKCLSTEGFSSLLSHKT